MVLDGAARHWKKSLEFHVEATQDESPPHLRSQQIPEQRDFRTKIPKRINISLAFHSYHIARKTRATQHTSALIAFQPLKFENTLKIWDILSFQIKDGHLAEQFHQSTITQLQSRRAWDPVSLRAGLSLSPGQTHVGTHRFISASTTPDSTV